MSVRKWIFGGCAVAAIAMLGSCINHAPEEMGAEGGTSTTSVQSAPTPTEYQDIWVGRVLSYPDIFSSPRLEIELSDGTTHVVEAAHTRRLYCRGAGELEAISDRLRQLTPIGSTITFVRGASTGWFGSRDDVGFIHLPENGHAATATPFGASVNEMLLREGRVDIADPTVNLSVMTGKTLTAAQYDRAPDESPNREYWPDLVGAYTEAWNGRVNIQADCRSADDRVIVERDQRDELDRIRRGPDGLYGTEDDDNNFYEFDIDGNLRIKVPAYSSDSGGSSSSGGGWGSGGGGFCRSRWC